MGESLILTASFIIGLGINSGCLLVGIVSTQILLDSSVIIVDRGHIKTSPSIKICYVSHDWLG